MTLEEGGRDPKQNPSPASLNSLLISAQIATRFSAVLESPFSATHGKLLTHIEATVIQSQLQTGTAVPKPLPCKRGALKNVTTALLYMGVGWFGQRKRTFYKKGD